MSTALTPFPIQVFSDTGVPLAGAKLYTYAAGTTDPASVYTTSTGNVAHANPVVADSAGRFAGIYLGETSYKFVLKTSADVVIWTQDNIFDAFLTATEGDVVDTESEQTIQNKTLDDTNIIEVLDENFTLDGPDGRRAQFDASDISDHVLRTFSFPDRSGTLIVADEEVGFLVIDGVRIDNPLPMETRWQAGYGANVASANNLTLGDDGNTFSVTGTTDVYTITTTGWTRGSQVTLECGGSQITFKNLTDSGAPSSAQLLLAGGDFEMSTADTLTLLFDGSVWLEVCRSVNHTPAVITVESAHNLILDRATNGANVFDLANSLTLDTQTISTLGWNQTAMVVIRATANVTIKHNTSSGASNAKKLYLKGATDYAMQAFDTLTLSLFSDYWTEVTRSVNH